MAAATDSYALGQAWQAWTDYQERMAFWGDRLPGWRAEYTRATSAVLAERLVKGPCTQDDRAMRNATHWKRLLDEHRSFAMAVESLVAFDQEFAVEGDVEGDGYRRLWTGHRCWVMTVMVMDRS